MANKELSSELTGLNKGEKELRKKHILIGISVAALSIFMLIIVLITVPIAPYFGIRIRFKIKQTTAPNMTE